MAESILKIEHMKKYFRINGRDQYVKAVDDVSFEIRKNEILGLVGESGSGKSTTAYCVVGMYGITGGKASFKDQDISMATSRRKLSLKKDIQIVFQDPGTSLNPRRNIGQILAMPIKVHKVAPSKDIEQKIFELLEIVNLPPETIHRYPRSLGGGERQLVAIARALATAPSLIVLDEPTSSLDVSVQARIINKLIEIREKFEMSYLFITHDMSLMRNIADRIAIMYLGHIVELAPAKDFFENPLHPYTKMLVSSIPVVLKEEEAIKPEQVEATGEIPSPVHIPSGCRFHGRCPFAQEICSTEEPEMLEIEENHTVACHLCSGKIPNSIQKEETV